jgi:hypothetical protein
MDWSLVLAIFLGALLLFLVLTLLAPLGKDIRAALNEHRREKRIAADVSVELSTAVEPVVRVKALTQNVSRHGARVLTKMPWRQGDHLLVTLPRAVGDCPAQIAYCDALPRGFFAVGLTFSSSLYAWGLNAERSDHLWRK